MNNKRYLVNWYSLTKVNGEDVYWACADAYDFLRNRELAERLS